MHPFRQAVESGDIDAVVALLAEDVVFRSPVVFTPYQGREVVGLILQAVFRVFQDFRYTREIGAEGAADHALNFEARVGDIQLEGIDLLHTAPDGSVDELVVMVRPIKAVFAVAEAMKAELDASR